MSTLDQKNRREEPDQWSARRGRILEVVCAHFLASGKWPTVDGLQRQLDRGGENIDLDDATASMPPALGQVDHHRHLILTIEGLSHCSEAHPVLESVVAALRLAVERYLSDDLKPELGSADLVNELGLSDDAASRVSELLLREGWFFAGGLGEASSDWARELRREIRELIGMSSVPELLEVSRRRRGPSLPPVAATPAVDQDPRPLSPPLGPAPLYSERRRGRGRALAPPALARLFLSMLADFKRRSFFDQAFYRGRAR